jgi:peptide subunit release factor 1 (eRF1)
MTADGQAGKASKPTRGARTAPAAQADIPDDPQELAEDIKQTRAQVGQTVEALSAKLDPKTQLRETAEHVKGRVSATTSEVTSKVTDRAGTVGQQLRGATAKAARSADENRVPLAVAAGVAVLLAGAWITWAIRRR